MNKIDNSSSHNFSKNWSADLKEQYNTDVVKSIRDRGKFAKERVFIAKDDTDQKSKNNSVSSKFSYLFGKMLRKLNKYLRIPGRSRLNQLEKSVFKIVLVSLFFLDWVSNFFFLSIFYFF